MKNLKKEYELICNEYISEFVAKHGYEFDYWVADEVGGTASFIDQYFFTLDQIRYDIDNKVKKNKIFEWQDWQIERHVSGKDSDINFKTWLKL